MEISFAKGSGWEQQLITAYSFRFTETPVFTQEADHIRTAVNPHHREGFDNISLLTPETYGVGVTATLHCAWEGLGCPEIILVGEMEHCPDGAVRYGACFEEVLYRNGINVWRHYRTDGHCHWHRRLGLEYSVAENTVHCLKLQVLEQALVLELNEQKTTLRTEDLPQKFHVGITGCEGIARLYAFSVNP